MIRRQIEVEIKVYLGEKKEAEKLLNSLKKHYAKLELLDHSVQLNHYFLKGNGEQLIAKLDNYLNARNKRKLSDIIVSFEEYSLRTRQANGKILLVAKASHRDADNIHGHGRFEFEEPINISTLDELDLLILQCGFNVQSKWSRERNLYKYKDLKVSIDLNAGYGYIAEFEKMVSNERESNIARDTIKKELAFLDLRELESNRLGRMFTFYNLHWKEYYKTNKTFILK